MYIIKKNKRHEKKKLKTYDIGYRDQGSGAQNTEYRNLRTKRTPSWKIPFA